MKKCNKCKLIKQLSEFHKSKDGFNGVRAICKECLRKCDRDFYQKNKERIIPIKVEKAKIYYQENIESRKEYAKKYHEENKVLKGRPPIKTKEEKDLRIKKWQLENREHINKLNRDRRKNNGDAIRLKNREWRKNPHNKILSNIRNRMYYALVFNQKSDTTIKLLGIDIESYKEYLECMFDDKMTWENYGSYWSVDHIVPLSFFDLTIKENQFKAFNFRNTRPLENIENISKNNRSITQLYDAIGIDILNKILETNLIIN